MAKGWKSQEAVHFSGWRMNELALKWKWEHARRMTVTFCPILGLKDDNEEVAKSSLCWPAAKLHWKLSLSVMNSLRIIPRPLVKSAPDSYALKKIQVLRDFKFSDKGYAEHVIWKK